MPTATVSLSIQGMSCASCVGRVDRALAAVDGVTSVAVNLATEQARIAFPPDRVTPATIAAASTELGYPARIADRSTTVDRGTRRSEEAALLKQRFVIGPF